MREHVTRNATNIAAVRSAVQRGDRDAIEKALTDLEAGQQALAQAAQQGGQADQSGQTQRSGSSQDRSR